MNSARLILVSVIAALFRCTAAGLAYNEVKAKQFAESVLLEGSKKVLDRSYEFGHLPDFKVLIPPNGKFIHLLYTVWKLLFPENRV